MLDPSSLISTILKHDSKQTSYKIALLRAINDVVLSFPDLGRQQQDIAIPLRTLAEFWIAYYWPFVSEAKPILQGARTLHAGALRQDMAFRDALTALRGMWEEGGSSSPADGFHLINEMRIARKRQSYPPALLKQYNLTVQKIAQTIRQPVQYAGPGHWQVFARPQRYAQLGAGTACLPGTTAQDACVVVPAALWRTFQGVSLWVEALCIHEWCLFTEGVEQETGSVTRGEVYTLLTERPGNRLPLTWERNHINLLLDEGQSFTCPWTFKEVQRHHYHLDHLVPVSVYPFNELWNLAPCDPLFNSHTKRHRLPTSERLFRAAPYLTGTYRTYGLSPTLANALRQDAALRFSALQGKAVLLPEEVTASVVDLIQQVAESRNLPRF